MEKTKVINYKGIDIFYINFSNLKNQDEVFSVIDEASKYITSQKENSLYLLTNLTDTFFNSAIKSRMKDYLEQNKPFTKKSAVFGMSGLIRILYNGLMKITGRDVRSFDTEENAKKFLAH